MGRHTTDEPRRLDARHLPRGVRSPIIVVAIVLGVAIVIGLAIFWPGAVEPPPDSALLVRGQIVRARVILTEVGPCGGVEGTEALASELLRTFAGSIGLIMAMPISTWLASRVASSDRSFDPTPNGSDVQLNS